MMGSEIANTSIRCSLYQVICEVIVINIHTSFLFSFIYYLGFLLCIFIYLLFLISSLYLLEICQGSVAIYLLASKLCPNLAYQRPKDRVWFMLDKYTQYVHHSLGANIIILNTYICRLSFKPPQLQKKKHQCWAILLFLAFYSFFGEERKRL